jgi:signal transduction histidine kinase
LSFVGSRDDGWDLLEELRRKLPSIPIVMLSGNDGEDARVRALQNVRQSAVAARPRCFHCPPQKKNIPALGGCLGSIIRTRRRERFVSAVSHELRGTLNTLCGIAVERIVMNLFENACKYACQPGASVDLNIRCKGKYMEINVRDHGSGIDAITRAKIFSQNIAPRNGSKSLGLGLPLSRNIARALGGGLRLPASSSAGTCFQVPAPAAGKRSRRTGPIECAF